MATPRPLLVDLTRALLAAFGAALLPCTFLAAWTAPLGEPYRDWQDYFTSCAKASVFLAACLTIPMLLCTVGLVALASRHRPDRAQAAISGMLAVWWLIPFIIAWAAATLLASSYQIRALFWTSGVPMPSQAWKPLLMNAGSPLWGLALCVAGAFWIMGMCAKRWRQYGLMAQSCLHCGYPIHGLPTPLCPECGHARPSTDDQ